MSAPGPGRALFEFVRHWSRRLPEERAALGRLVVVVEAVDALARRDEFATVNAVARELGIDQSGASRGMKEAAERECLELRAHEHDGRARHAVITAVGHRMLADAHDWQEQVFAQLTEGWSAPRRRAFERAMNDIVDRSYELGG